LKQKDAFEAQKEKEVMEELRIQKEMAQKAIECIQCGTFIDHENYKKFPKGNVCRSCFLSANGENIKKWSETGAKE